MVGAIMKLARSLDILAEKFTAVTDDSGNELSVVSTISPREAQAMLQRYSALRGVMTDRGGVLLWNAYAAIHDTVMDQLGVDEDIRFMVATDPRETREAQALWGTKGYATVGGAWFVADEDGAIPERLARMFPPVRIESFLNEKSYEIDTYNGSTLVIENPSFEQVVGLMNRSEYDPQERLRAVIDDTNWYLFDGASAIHAEIERGLGLTDGIRAMIGQMPDVNELGPARRELMSTSRAFWISRNNIGVSLGNGTRDQIPSNHRVFKILPNLTKAYFASLKPMVGESWGSNFWGAWYNPRNGESLILGPRQTHMDVLKRIIPGWDIVTNLKAARADGWCRVGISKEAIGFCQGDQIKDVRQAMKWVLQQRPDDTIREFRAEWLLPQKGHVSLSELDINAFVQRGIIPRTIQEKLVSTDYIPFQLNPTRNELIGFVQRTKDGVARGLISPTGDMYVWDAERAVHDQARAYIESSLDEHMENPKAYLMFAFGDDGRIDPEWNREMVEYGPIRIGAYEAVKISQWNYSGRFVDPITLQPLTRMFGQRTQP